MQGLGRAAHFTVEITDETAASACGDGCGILLVAETSEGCLLGAASVGAKGRQAQQVGADAAADLLQDIRAGGCVDRWCAGSAV